MTVRAKVKAMPSTRRPSTCGRCGETGHNKATCKAKSPPRQPPRWRRYHLRNRADGLCTQCPTPATAAGRCEIHREKYNRERRVDHQSSSTTDRKRKRQKQLRAQRHADGLCPACGGDRGTKYRTCLDCLAKARDGNRKLVESMK